MLYAAKHRILFLGIGCMALFMVLAASAFFFVFSNAEEAKEPEPVAQSFVTDMTYVDLPRITVSLGNTGTRQMQVDLSLEVASKDATLIEGYQPQITERLNVYFSGLPAERKRWHESDASLRREILIQINKTKAPVVVHDLLVRQLIIL